MNCPNCKEEMTTFFIDEHRTAYICRCGKQIVQTESCDWSGCGYKPVRRVGQTMVVVP